MWRCRSCHFNLAITGLGCSGSRALEDLRSVWAVAEDVIYQRVFHQGQEHKSEIIFYILYLTYRIIGKYKYTFFCRVDNITYLRLKIELPIAENTCRLI